MTTPHQASILLADDEETFLEATCELLRLEGYDCHGAADAVAAATQCEQQRFDLIVADIKMPGNGELQFVRELPRLAPGTPIILITGYPTLDTAIEALRLTVFDYLCKPISFDEFHAVITRALESAEALRAMERVRQRLDNWREDAACIQENAASPASRTGNTTYTAAFADSAYRNLAAAAADLGALTRAVAAKEGVADPCRALHCPRLHEYREVISEAVDILERTRSAFKSQELARLRKRMETMLLQN